MPALNFEFFACDKSPLGILCLLRRERITQPGALVTGVAMLGPGVAYLFINELRLSRHCIADIIVGGASAAFAERDQQRRRKIGERLMDTVSSLMAELKKKGSEQTRKTFRRHGAPEEMFGVKVGDLKPIAKRIKGQQQLACELYDTGNSDAMYLAGLVVDGAQMARRQLNDWAKKASWYMISEYTVPGVAAESEYARDLALKWMNAKKESVAACGWCTYVGILATRADDELDLDEIKRLLKRAERDIAAAPNRVRYCMNDFIIAVGTYVKPLLAQAKATAKKVGKVEVDMGETACKVPLAAEYIAKVEKMGRVGRKRKTMKC